MSSDQNGAGCTPERSRALLPRSPVLPMLLRLLSLRRVLFVFQIGQSFTVLHVQLRDRDIREGHVDVILIEDLQQSQ